jgi:hypothetical protein
MKDSKQGGFLTIGALNYPGKTTMGAALLEEICRFLFKSMGYGFRQKALVITRRKAGWEDICRPNTRKNLPKFR